MVVAYEHHMRYDFSGYPSVPPDWRQNLVSQMTAISDYFDAMRTKRSYRDAVESNRIASIMKEQIGTGLHPGLTQNFFRILKNMLKTDSGSTGIGGPGPSDAPVSA